MGLKLDPGLNVWIERNNEDIVLHADIAGEECTNCPLKIKAQALATLLNLWGTEQWAGGSVSGAATPSAQEPRG